ncbi:MAG TPA: acetyl-CoA hydrolase/transferase C-terminal domain-containing protein [Candidatus Obscuribacterales bacterium]
MHSELSIRSSVSAAEAVALIRPLSKIFIQGAAATPHVLIDALVTQGERLQKSEIYHLHTDGPVPYVQPQHRPYFHVNALFTGANLRQAVAEGDADYIPVFLSEVPLLFRRGIIPLDVALIHVSPPDIHGFCSLGTSVDVVLAALESAPLVIAQVNPRMPRTHGDGMIHMQHIHAWVTVDQPLPEAFPPSLDATQLRIGQHCAELIEDGATLQMGIGAIPDAVLTSLGGHSKLGVHTEMFSDGVIDLVEKGVITGEAKKIHPYKIVAGFVMGTRRLYDFVHDNPLVAMLDIGYVNRTDVIRRNPKVTAINSAIEVDLTGQVCADSIGPYQFSGVGGQMDFIRGASLSEGGKPIIALPSVTNKGESRIAATLKAGASVVTTRAHVHYIVTEYGAAHLYGRNLRQRARALIEIAHPDHRAELEKLAYERFKVL